MLIPRHDSQIVSILKNGNGIGSIELENADEDLLESLKEMLDGWNFKRENADKAKTITK